TRDESGGVAEQREIGHARLRVRLRVEAVAPERADVAVERRARGTKRTDETGGVASRHAGVCVECVERGAGAGDDPIARDGDFVELAVEAHAPELDEVGGSQRDELSQAAPD